MGAAAKVVPIAEEMEYLEIDPSTKEGRELLESLVSSLKGEDIVDQFRETFSDYQVEVVRVKDYIRMKDGSLVHTLKHKLLVFMRREEDGEWKTKRLGLKTVNHTYTLIPHSELQEEVATLIRKAGYTPKTFIKYAGVNFRSLTIVEGAEVELEGEKLRLGFVINNSYNYSSAVRIHLVLLGTRALYPLWSDILYKKHRKDEITTEDFDKSLKFAEELVKALPLLRKIRVNVVDVLSEMEKVKVRKWVKKEDGKKELIEVPVGEKVVAEVVKRAGRTTDVYTLWKTVSEVVFSRDHHITGLSLRLKRRFEVMIAKLIENFLASLGVVGV